MRIIFFGSSEFSIPSLEGLINSRHEVLALVTQPDRKKGRHLLMGPPATKKLAIERKINVLQPERADSAIDGLTQMRADLFVVVSFGQILSKKVLSIPRFCAINLHSSLLPKYRGAAPINWAMINGDSVTGITVMRMNEQMDKGDIILQKELKIGESDTSVELGERLARIGAEGLLEAVDLIENGKACYACQDEGKATSAAKLKKAHGLIDWKRRTGEICNMVRGLQPWPGAYTYIGKDLIKIYKAEAIDGGSLDKGALPGAKPGQIAALLGGKGIVVKTFDGYLKIADLQMEGKKRMPAEEFLLGHKVKVGEVLKARP